MKGTSMYMDKARVVAISILEEFENLLQEKKIEIPSDDRHNNSDEACLFGSEYYALEDKVAAILRENGMVEKEK